MIAFATANHFALLLIQGDARLIAHFANTFCHSFCSHRGFRHLNHSLPWSFWFGSNSWGICGLSTGSPWQTKTAIRIRVPGSERVMCGEERTARKDNRSVAVYSVLRKRNVRTKSGLTNHHQWWWELKYLYDLLSDDCVRWLSQSVPSLTLVSSLTTAPRQPKPWRRLHERIEWMISVPVPSKWCN